MGKIKRIEVPPEDRERLERLVRARTAPQKIVWRSRIVLLAGEGIGALEAATRVGNGVLTVRRWRRRYVAKGVDGFETRDPPVRAGDQKTAHGNREPYLAWAILADELQRDLGRPRRYADHRSTCVEFRRSDAIGRAPVMMQGDDDARRLQDSQWQAYLYTKWPPH
jgi:hypothetical protein